MTVNPAATAGSASLPGRLEAGTRKGDKASADPVFAALMAMFAVQAPAGTVPTGLPNVTIATPGAVPAAVAATVPAALPWPLPVAVPVAQSAGSAFALPLAGQALAPALAGQAVPDGAAVPRGEPLGTPAPVLEATLTEGPLLFPIPQPRISFTARLAAGSAPRATAGNEQVAPGGDALPLPGGVSGTVPDPGLVAGAIPDPGLVAGAVPDPATAAGAVPDPGLVAGAIPDPGAVAGAVPDPATAAGAVLGVLRGESPPETAEADPDGVPVQALETALPGGRPLFPERRPRIFPATASPAAVTSSRAPAPDAQAETDASDPSAPGTDARSAPDAIQAPAQAAAGRSDSRPAQLVPDMVPGASLSQRRQAAEVVSRVKPEDPLGAVSVNWRPPVPGPEQAAAPPPLHRLAASLPQPLAPDRLLQAIGESVRQSEPGQYSVTLKLYPEQLGEVRLEIRLSGREVQTVMHVTRPEAQQALQQHSDHLRQSLDQAGLTLAGFEVSTGSGGQTARDRQTQAEEMAREQNRGRSDGGAAPIGPAPATAPRLNGDRRGGRLDTTA